MTQFAPPPPPQTPHAAAGPPPWSAAAIAGFVCACLGCTGVLAPIGLILGIVGIMKTGAGQRRGRGLAIAAIPVSLLSGALFVVLGLMTFGLIALWPFFQALPAALNADSTEMAQAIALIREASSAEFNQSVGDKQLTAWITQVQSKHGKVVKTENAIPLTPPPGQTDDWMFAIPAKFVNGPTNIQLTFRSRGWQLALHDIQIDGVSPRDMPE